MTEILDKAIEAYRRQQFLAGLNSDLAALRRKPVAWQKEQAERMIVGRHSLPTASRANLQ